MENRIVKFKSKESAGLNLHAIPGHFATSHSHINYYVDVTSIKTRVSEAKEAAKALYTKVPHHSYIDKSYGNCFSCNISSFQLERRV